MTNKLKEQLEVLIEGFFGNSDKEKENISEIIVKEWYIVYYMDSSEWLTHKLKFKLDDLDIINIQKTIISEKFEWEEKLEEDFFYNFKKHWHVNYSYTIRWIPLRINWSLWQWKSFMRIRKLPFRMFKPNDLSVPEIIREEVKKYKEWGLIIVSARPGSWKSTTIASILQELFNNEIVNVVTLEDPIEYIYSKDSKSIIEQREKIFDFDTLETWVEACMRQTPDIVVVQEMTTPSIVREVIRLVEKWVMVITTLHTPDTTSIFDSIVWSYTPEEKHEILNKLSTLFRCFISQRLIKRKNWKWKVAVFEVLTNTNQVKWYIKDDNTKNLSQLMTRKPHLLMSDSIVDKIENQEISLEKWLESCPYSRIIDLKDKIWMN